MIDFNSLFFQYNNKNANTFRNEFLEIFIFPIQNKNIDFKT